MNDNEIIVDITPRLKTEELEKEAKRAEKLLNKNMKRSGTGSFFSKFEKMLPSSLRGVGHEFGKLRTASKGAGGPMKNAAMAGAVGGIFAAFTMGVMGALKKLVHFAVDASPMLKNMVKLLNFGFMMVLRPIGDVLAMLLRPVALFFRAIGRAVIMRMRERRAQLKKEHPDWSNAEIGMELMGELPTMYMEVFGEAISKIDWERIFAAMFRNPQTLAALAGLGLLVLAAILLAIGTMYVLAALGGLVLSLILGAVGVGMGGLGVLGGAVLGRLLGALSTGLGALGTFGSKVLTRIMTAIGAMGVLGTLGTLIIGAAILAVNNWVNSPESQTFVEGMLGVTHGTTHYEGNEGAGKPMNWDEIPPGPSRAAEGRIGETFKGSDLGSGRWEKPFEDIYNFFGGHGPLFGQQGAMVTGTGAVIAHKGELLKDTGQVRSFIYDAVAEALGGGGGRDINVTVVLPGAAMKEAMERGVDVYHKNKISNRGR